MPWRGPEFDGEIPSLGWDLLDWLSTFLPSPRNPDEPLIFTDEQARLLVDWYSVDPKSGKFVYRRGCSRRSKGWGKSPLEAAKAIAELAGPVRFAGWDAQGEPVGRPWGTQGDPSAWVQIAAVSEDQTENTHSVVHEFLNANDGKAADALGIDAGLTRSYLRGNRRGKLEPVTAAAGTREGQPVTYGVLDETHLWTPRNGGVRLARTLRRNVAKMDGRSYETTNSFEPGEQSVAEDTHKSAEKGTAGVFYDAVEAPEIDVEKATDEELRESLKIPYGDSWWVTGHLDRLVADIRDPDTPIEDSWRFFFNWNRKGQGKAVDPKRWDALANPQDVPAKTVVALGFDGSIYDDSTALIGYTMDGYLFRLNIWSRPMGAPKDWRIPRGEVREAVLDAKERFHVGRMYCDPAKWWTEIDEWAEFFGNDRDDQPIVVIFDTNQPTRMAPACDRFATAVLEGSLTHDGDPTLTAHVLAMGRRKVRIKDEDDDGRTRYVFVKSDTRKIDAGIGAVLAVEAGSTLTERPDSVYEDRGFVTLG